jgi:glyoxylase-like metal-dependent hydrolase (beta-lactamase superfamily II)
MNKKIGFVILISLSVAAGLAVPAWAQQNAPARAIVQVAGDLYRAQNAGHFTVFLVTPEGIVLSDPINAEFSNWLKGELSARFNQPVRYVLYSHYHDDHASGGAVWADTAELIGHANMPGNLAAEAGNPIFAAVRAPDRTFTDRLTITLGGKTVELIHSPPSHSTDATILYFPAERAVFAVDWLNIRRVPYRTMSGAPIGAWIEASRQLQSLDYDIAIPGHGEVGSKADVDESIRYLEDLRAAVEQGVAEGKGLAELQGTITMDGYAHFGQRDAWLAENVQGVYEQLTSN